jgi:hypothetical protein
MVLVLFSLAALEVLLHLGGIVVIFYRVSGNEGDDDVVVMGRLCEAKSLRVVACVWWE